MGLLRREWMEVKPRTSIFKFYLMLTATLQVSDIPRGVYLLQVHTQGGTCYYRKVVLE